MAQQGNQTPGSEGNLRRPARRGGRRGRRSTAATAATLDAAGYGRIETPIFEDTGLFERGVGESTDIVRKEMFTFEDQGGRSITLRPEGTAPICRAYVEHGMHKLAQPVKLWYQGPYFRYERPQEGRFRQFNQIGAEAIGADSRSADAELIILLDRAPARARDRRSRAAALVAGLEREPRAAYREELRDYLRGHEADLSAEVRERIDSNPMRAFDADDRGTRAVMAERAADDRPARGPDAEHFDHVKALLDGAGVAYTLDGSLVRGLDYYNRTVFEFACDRLGAQSGVGGGGRYDGLVELLGGPPTPAVGWAAGIERILLAMEGAPAAAGIDVFVVSAEDRDRAFALVDELRRRGLGADLDLGGRSFKGQMKQADRSGARRTVILEADGTAKLREMESGAQRDVGVETLVAELTASAD